jgi:hypothetical protein
MSSVGPLPYESGGLGIVAGDGIGLSQRSTSERLIGTRVTIRAVKSFGSAKVLDGLTGTVTALHPIAHEWVIVRFDLNEITEYRDWPVPASLLVIQESVLGTGG